MRKRNRLWPAHSLYVEKFQKMGGLLVFSTQDESNETKHIIFENIIP